MHRTRMLLTIPILALGFYGLSGSAFPANAATTQPGPPPHHPTTKPAGKPPTTKPAHPKPTTKPTTKPASPHGFPPIDPKGTGSLKK